MNLDNMAKNVILTGILMMINKYAKKFGNKNLNIRRKILRQIIKRIKISQNLNILNLVSKKMEIGKNTRKRRRKKRVLMMLISWSKILTLQMHNLQVTQHVNSQIIQNFQNRKILKNQILVKQIRLQVFMKRQILIVN